VRPGDILHATSKCIAKRPSGKRSDAGLATMHHELKRRNGEVVMTFDSVNLVYRRPAT
jgi:acyl dehydratase